MATETGRWATCHRHVAAPIGGAETCLPRWGRCHRGAMTEGVAALVVLSPLPPPTSFVSGGNWLTVVGGGFLFLLIISFSKGAVSAAASVGDGRSPLATIAPLCIPHGGERTPRGVCLYLAASFAKAKLGRASRATRDLARAHTPVRARLALDYYKKGVSKGAIAPFEMRCIEYSPPPVQKSYPPFLIPLTGGGRGWGEMGYPPVAPMA